MPYFRGMKFFLVCLFGLSLVSCNTAIGVWRDTKVGFNWTKEKIQGAGSEGSQEYEYGAPIY